MIVESFFNRKLVRVSAKRSPVQIIIANGISRWWNGTELMKECIWVGMSLVKDRDVNDT